MRRLRPVPAALPDVPRQRRGGAVAARSDRRDASRRVARRPDRRRLRRTSSRRACSAGVASRRARAGCRTVTSSRRPRRRSPSATTSRRAGSGRLRDALPTSDPARRVDAARGRPAAARLVPRAGRRLADPPAAAPRSPAGVDRGAGRRTRRVAVHRMRDGRLAAGDAPRHGGARRRDRRDAPAGRRIGPAVAARCTSTPGWRTRLADWPRRVIADMPGDGADPRQLGRLRRGAEGLRTAARHRRRGRVRRPRGRRPRVARRPRRRAAPTATHSLGPVIVQDPCHLRHVQRAHLPVRTVLGPLRRRGRARRRRPVLRRRWRLRRRCSRRSRPTIRQRKLAAIDRAPHGERGHHRGQRQPRAAPCTSPPPASTCAIPSTSSPSRPAWRMADEPLCRARRPARGDRRRARRPVARPAAARRSPRARRNDPTPTGCSPRPAGRSRRRSQLLQRVAADERVDDVDQRSQVAVAVAGELEADPRQLGVVVLADLDRRRAPLRSMRPAATRLAKRSSSTASCSSVGRVAQPDHGLVADVADRVVVGVEALDLLARRVARRR